MTTTTDRAGLELSVSSALAHVGGTPPTARAGLPASRTLPDGSVTTWGYDPADRLTSLVTTVPSGVLSFAYERDANGSVTAENSTRYGYDALNRLTSWYDPSTNSTTAYSYDANYNLTSVAVDGVVTRSLSYDAADRISSPGYTFDDNGNMTSDGTNTYAYDAMNRLSAVTDANGAVIASYAYDFMNRRVSSTDSSGTTYFHYDGASPDVIAETDGAGNTTASYAYDAAGRLHSMTRGGATYYYHANAHGDVVALTDASGAVVDSYRYDPWGRVLEASGTVENPYRYAGYRYDGATGLYHLWNRYYSPSDFRFVTKDLYPGQAKAPGTMNGYAYCLDDPVNLVDPTGLLGWGDAARGGAVLGIIVVGAIGLAGPDEIAAFIAAALALAAGYQAVMTGGEAAPALGGEGGALATGGEAASAAENCYRFSSAQDEAIGAARAAQQAAGEGTPISVKEAESLKGMADEADGASTSLSKLNAKIHYDGHDHGVMEGVPHMHVGPEDHIPFWYGEWF